MTGQGQETFSDRPGTETLLVTGQGQETFSDRPGTGDI